MNKVLAVLLCLLLAKSAFSQNRNNEEDSFKHLDAYEKNYTETPIRRGEIVFFLSLPFVTAITYGATALVYLAATGDSNLSMPPLVSVFAISSSFLITGAIVRNDLMNWDRNSSSEIIQSETYYYAAWQYKLAYGQ
ncbi:MAG: hypothetical protein KDK41_04240 [Leptospiraceae bacterium]|nr:hypothetical protein [Leptospiraceae bacterium]